MITVNGRILENRYTTDQWTTANPILLDRIEGYEVDDMGLPVGMKMGDGITAWNDLPYWFTDSIPGGQVIVPITTNPFVYASGITDRIPPIASYLKTGTVYQKYGEPTFDKSNGNVMSDVYTGSEDYVLVVG